MTTVYFPKILQPFYCEDLIRIGKSFDGGYLVNKKDVEKTDVLLSVGIGDDCSFEEQFVRVKNCPVVAYDRSSKLHEFFTGSRKLIYKNMSDTTTNDTIGFVDALKEFDSNVFFKCDIEGDEYKILDDIITNSHKFSGMVLEVHELTEYKNFDTIADFVSKIRMDLVHVHINNYSYIQHGENYTPQVLELSFTSSKNVSLKRELNLPHRLDMPCNPVGKVFSIVFQ